MEPSPTTARIEELLAHADWVRALARNLSRDDADADDLAQETWLAAVRRPPQDPRRAWLGGVLRNLSRMRWRAAGRRARREETAAGTRAAPPAPDDVVARMEMHRLLADAVLRLDEPWRSTVVRRYLDGLTSAEIARLEGIPAATVRGRLKTALARLRDDLDGRHDGHRDAWLAGLGPLLGLSAADARRLLAEAPPATPATPVAWGLGLGLAAALGLVVWLVAAGGKDAGGAPPSPPPAEPAPHEAGGVPGGGTGGAREKPAPPHGLTADEEGEGGGQPAAPPASPATPTAPAHEATPAGMTYVPPGTAVIGTTWERLAELLRGRNEQVQRDFVFEAPQRRVAMEGFFLDRYELTNAQYLRFLRDSAAASYDTDTAAFADLEAVAGGLTGLTPDRWAKDDVAWRQLYRANRDTLHAAMPGVVVRDPAGRIDEQKTEDAFRHAPLVRGMVLRFFSRKPPETWPSTEPRPGHLDRPVTSISYDDAEAYAEWAGKHVPTEEEWEYAARGPQGCVYPWGDDWFPDTSHANWGGWVEDEHYEPRMMGVDTLPEGRSWCGAHHMLGNAAEWTSSWFAPYPGNDHEDDRAGEYLKVIRGATFVDSDLLVLRCAARNFIGGGMKAPPLPGNRFEYVGVRCAAYPGPGRDRLDVVVRRTARARRIIGADLDLTAYAGAATTRFAAPGEAVENHVYVVGRSHAIVVIPLRGLDGPDAGRRGVRSRKELLAASEHSADPIPLAVLHTDVGFTGLAPIRGPAGPRTCPPGTWILGLWHGRLCLAEPSLEAAFYLGAHPATKVELDVVRLGADADPGAGIEIDPDADAVSLSLRVSLARGGEVFAVLRTVALTTTKGALAEAGAWRVTR